MATGEFDLIERYFRPLGVSRDDVTLGIGDDAALLAPGGAARLGVAWASTSSALQEHPGATGEGCAESAIRQLLDEGVTPAWLTLALTVNEPGDAWIAAFASGVKRACERHRVALVGGDTTAGPVAATVFATGPVAGT